jgi:cell division protein FtsX
MVMLALGLLAACSTTVTPTPPQTTRLAVYLSNDATTAQKSAVAAKVGALPGVGTVGFVSHEEAYRRFKELFKDRPDVLAAASPDNLPESYETVVTGTIDDAALAELRKLPGVDQVTTPLRGGGTPPTPSR